MSFDDNQLRIVHSETPINEIWARLRYFETERNVKDFLQEKFDLPEEDLIETSSNLAFAMRTASEYYESAKRVSLLTRPLLIFYGMTALSKVLFASTYGKKSPSKAHGLSPPIPGTFAELSTTVLKDGAFPQFHSCFSKKKLYRMKFKMRELLSLIPEVKVEYETVYNEKSRALRVLRTRYGASVVDTEIEKYGNLAEDLRKFFPEIQITQAFGKRVNIFLGDIPAVLTVSAEEYLVLPLRKHNRDILFPEMSVHFLTAYLLGIISRYHPKEWGETIEGKESGEIYIIQKFLETTTRKFPNLILNKLRNRSFVFVSPQLATQKKLDSEQLEEIYEYVSRKMGEDIGRRRP